MKKNIQGVFFALLVVFLFGFKSDSETEILTAGGEEFNHYGVVVRNAADSVVVEYQGRRVAKYRHEDIPVLIRSQIFFGINLEIERTEGNSFRVEVAFRPAFILWEKSRANQAQAGESK